MTEAGIAGFRILIVEDESLVSMLIEDILATLRCRVVGRAARLGQARALLERESVDCAILDINVSGEAIYPLAETLAQRGIPFVFVSGYGRSGVPDRFQDRPILQKPFHPDELRDRLLSAVKRPTGAAEVPLQ